MVNINISKTTWQLHKPVAFNSPVIDKPINSLLSQLPSVLVVVVVFSPAEHHQAFRLGISDVGEVLKQLLGVATDTLKEQDKWFNLAHLKTKISPRLTRSFVSLKTG